MAFFTLFLSTNDLSVIAESLETNKLNLHYFTSFISVTDNCSYYLYYIYIVIIQLNIQDKVTKVDIIVIVYDAVTE